MLVRSNVSNKPRSASREIGGSSPIAYPSEPELRHYYSFCGVQYTWLVVQRHRRGSNTGLAPFREHLHDHKRDIVHRLDIAAEDGEAFSDRVGDLVGRARGTFTKRFAQTILAVLLPLRVRCFPHPVRADEENLTGPQRGSLLHVLHVVHDPQRQIAFPHLRKGSVRGVVDDDRILPGAYPAHGAGL